MLPAWFKRRRWFIGATSGAASIMLNYVQGPADGVSTDNALVRWDATTGRLVQNSGAILSDAGALVLPAGGSAEVLNTGGLEYARLSWSGNVFSLDVGKTTGSDRVARITNLNGQSGIELTAVQGIIKVLGAAPAIWTNTAGTGLKIRATVGAQTTALLELDSTASLSASSGTQVGLAVSPIMLQTGTAGYKALRVNVTETSTGSGQKDLASFEVAGAARWSCDNNGSSTACVGTAIPAGGTTGRGLKFSSTANYGVFFGSGAPSLTAAKGSLYLRSDGTGTTDRAYINTDGGTTWTAITTAA